MLHGRQVSLPTTGSLTFADEHCVFGTGTDADFSRMTICHGCIFLGLPANWPALSPSALVRDRLLQVGLLSEDEAHRVMDELARLKVSGLRWGSQGPSS